MSPDILVYILKAYEQKLFELMGPEKYKEFITETAKQVCKQEKEEQFKKELEAHIRLALMMRGYDDQ